MANCQNPQVTPSRIRRPLFYVLFSLLSLHALAIYLTPDSWRMLDSVVDMRETLGVSKRSARRSAGFARPNKVLTIDGKPYLWAGPNESDHFDISKFLLNPDQLHYGLGRERFPALIEPDFMTVEEADRLPYLRHPQREGVLAVKIGEEVKVYPLAALLRYEVVNDVVGDTPIFAAYCYLANLGAVYDRRINDHTFTFAVSGYTYADPEIWDGRDAFVLWDRDTESLWWPPVGKSVSGPAIHTPMKVLEQELWAQTTWQQVKEKYPNAKVLRFNQSMKRPVAWPLHEIKQQKDVVNDNVTDSMSIAPRWGKNDGL